MEFRQLRYLIAAAEHGSFRRAAAALGIQESTLSRGIRGLEDAIGVDLFNRRHAGVVLTHAGQRLLIRAKKIAGQVGDATREAGTVGRGEEGVVRVGIMPSMVSAFFTELLKLYSANHPGVRLDLIEGLPSEHIAAVQQCQLDVVFMTSSSAPEDCDIVHLWKERILVVLSESHRLRDRQALRWDDLRDEHFIVTEVSPGPEAQDFIARNLGVMGFRPNLERCSVGRDNLLQLVAIGRGLSVTCEATRGAGFPGVIYRCLEGESVPFSALWSTRNANPALRRLLSMARVLAQGH